MTRATVIAAVRAWLLLALAAAVPEVIEADGKGPRPVLPYLVVNISSATPVGTDEEIHGMDGPTPIKTVRGLRRATVTVNGYGLSTFDMLETISLSLRTNAVRDLNTVADIEVEEFGGTTDISTLLDTQIEKRFLREFEVFYEVTVVEEQIALAEVEIDATYESPGLPDLTETIIITV